MRALLLFTLFSLTAFGAPLEPYRHNFFTTNPSPVVEVVAGTNTSVQYSTAGTHTRRYTVNSLQSPWTGDIDGGNHSLTNVDDIASDGGTFSASVLEAGSRVQTPELYIPDSMMLDYDGIRATNHFELNSQTGDAWFGGTISGDGSGLTNLNASSLASGTVPTARLCGAQFDDYALTGTNIVISPTNGNLQSLVLTNESWLALDAADTNYTESIRLNVYGSNTLYWTTGNLSNTASLGPSNSISVMLFDHSRGTNLWWGMRIR